MKIKISFLLVIITLYQFIGCTDESHFDPINEPLPLATSTGANSFGFLLNDKTWLPFTEDNKQNAMSVVMDNDSIFMFSLNLISDNIKRNESLKIFLSCNKPGPCIPISFKFINDNNILGCQIYDLKINNLQFEITHIDFMEKIISGNFQILGATNSCRTEIINISKGRFDCKFSK